MILRKSSFKIVDFYLLLFFLFVFLNFLFSKNLSLFADLPIVTNAPNERTINAYTMGDNEFFYRLKAFKVQTMGDTFGRFSPLRFYDYEKLYSWFIELEKLNYISNYLPSMVAYYYSQTPNIDDKKYVVKFLVYHALKNPSKKWWWLYQASYIANYEIKDSNLAIRLAYILQKFLPYDAPIWAKQTPSVYLSESGNSCEAIRVINSVLKDISNIENSKEKDRELNYMNFFLKRESSKITEKDFIKCINNINY